jgi:hypothetical protein
MATQARSCHFPATGRQTSGPKRPLSVRLELQRLDLLQNLLEGDNDSRSLSAVMCAAWALSLRCYTGLSEVCFGFEEVGGSLHMDTEGLGDVSGSLVAMLRIEEAMLLNDLVRQGYDSHCISPDPSGKLDFNTSILLRSGTAAPGAKQSPNSTSVMSDKVPCHCSSCAPQLLTTVIVSTSPAGQSSEIRNKRLPGVSQLFHTNGTSQECC